MGSRITSRDSCTASNIKVVIPEWPQKGEMITSSGCYLLNEKEVESPPQNITFLETLQPIAQIDDPIQHIAASTSQRYPTMGQFRVARQVISSSGGSIGQFSIQIPGLVNPERQQMIQQGLEANRELLFEDVYRKDTIVNLQGHQQKNNGGVSSD